MASVHLGTALEYIHRLFGDGSLAGIADAQLLKRYVSRRDELAFEALVQRHGPMVMSVCRGILIDPNDADDAFQAAFLLLARKAGSLRVTDALGGWLHRVAFRVALQLKSDSARRRDRERGAAELASTGSLSSAPWDDRDAILHEEIDRLPERYRQPIVLCYLEEKTYQQAANHLRWSVGSTQGRLRRGRDLLKTRLTRRGVTLAGAGLSALTIPKATSAVSTAMIQATVRAARHFVLGEAAAVGTVSTAATALVNQALRSMLITKLKTAGAAALSVGVLAFVVSGLSALVAAAPHGLPAPPISNNDDRDSPAQASTNARPGEPANTTETTAETINFHGRVLGPDGRPATGVAIYTMLPSMIDPIEPVLRAKTNTDGRFRFAMPKADFDAAVLGLWRSVTILALADGLGPDWVDTSKPTDEEISLRLVDDSIPISGRILDLQGKPVVSAIIKRGRINAEGTDGIDPYLKLLRDDPKLAANHRFTKHFWNNPLPGQPTSVTTDAEGRFRLTGVGRDRIVELQIEAPTIQSATITAMTRPSATVSSPPGTGTVVAKTIYGASFDHLVPPGRALTGIVRDKGTKQPLTGVTVCGKGTNARVSTDAEGRFILSGFPKGTSYPLMVLAGQKAPYFVTCLNVPDTSGLAPIEANVDCVPGIPMRLKLIDKETGKPVTGADVAYFPVYPNPHAREVSGYAPVRGIGAFNSGIWQSDGTYVLGVLPGPGGVFVRTAETLYRPACVDPGAFFKTEAKQIQPGLGGDATIIFTVHGDGVAATTQSQFSAIVLVNPAEDSVPLTAEAVLERDQKREVHVVGPDDEPLTGVTVEGDGGEATKTPGLLTVSKLNPKRPTRFTFHDQAKKLAGSLIARGDETKPYVVKMQSWGTITGRLVDAAGKPRPKVDLATSDWQSAMIDPARGLITSGQPTGADGRFRYERLVPGQEYSAHAVGEQAAQEGFGVVIDRVVLKPGETCDLGDVQSRRAQPAPTP
jgi:RNA polymerase sigma factor (sigma-70 family)